MEQWISRSRALGLVLLAPLALLSCIFVPGKFESSLVVHADRSFTFRYKGEIVAYDLGGLMGKAMTIGMMQGLRASSGEFNMSATVPTDDWGSNWTDADDAGWDAAANAMTYDLTGNMVDDGAMVGNWSDATWPEDGMSNGVGMVDQDAMFANMMAPSPEEQALADEQYREVAVMIANEPGFRKVEYRGEGVFWVDYEISGDLSRGFVFPYNLDAQMTSPFFAVELRGKDQLRVKAPGFAKREGYDEIPTVKQTPRAIEGTFKLVTDAEIVSQNSEGEAKATGANRTVTWTVSALTADAPMAVLKVNPIK